MCVFCRVCLFTFYQKIVGSLSKLAYMTVCTVQQFDRTNMKNQYTFLKADGNFLARKPAFCSSLIWAFFLSRKSSFCGSFRVEKPPQSTLDHVSY